MLFRKRQQIQGIYDHENKKPINSKSRKFIGNILICLASVYTLYLIVVMLYKTSMIGLTRLQKRKDKRMHNKNETVRYYVRVAEINLRENLIETLENKGYKNVENSDNRWEIIESKYPIMVNITDKEYGVLHSITSAAAALSAGIVIEIQDIERIL